MICAFGPRFGVGGGVLSVCLFLFSPMYKLSVVSHIIIISQEQSKEIIDCMNTALCQLWKLDSEKRGLYDI